jgi:conjugative relaxase-like TrwC/TraI family protein
VLRLWKVRPGGHDYYLAVVPGAGSGVEPAGRWVGQAGRELGLQGEVEGSALARVLAGADPDTGEPMSPTHHRVGVAAYDLTFCAPKSVSIMHGIADREVADEVESGHWAAADAAVGYLERHGAAVRRNRGEARRVPVPVAGITAAAFRHGTSRSEDPRLHTHVVVANLGRTATGGWTALDGRGIYAHRAAADALYHAQLRHELTTRLGVAWGPLRRGRADVIGVEEPARREFSRRATSIEAALDRGGASTFGSSMYVSAATRPPKDPLVGPRELRDGWRARAREVGLGPRALEVVLDRAPRRPPMELKGTGELGVVAAEAGAALLSAHAGGSAPAPRRRHLVRQTCLALAAGAPADAVESAADLMIERTWPEVLARPVRAAGVAEPALTSPAALVRAVDDGALDRLLAARGMRPGRDRAPSRDYDVGMGLG